MKTILAALLALLGISGCHVEAATGLSMNGCLLKPGAQCAGVKSGFSPSTSLSRVNWTAANLSGTDFGGAPMTSAKLIRATALGTTFSGSVLTQSDLSHGDFTDSVFSTLDEKKPTWLVNINARNATFKGAKFNNAHMSSPEANIPSNYNFADFADADFTGVKALGAVFDHASFENARSFLGADFTNANAQSADMRGANLAGINLTGAYLQESNLECANFTNAKVQGANISQTDLSWANVVGTLGENGGQLNKADGHQAIFCRTIVGLMPGAHGQPSRIVYDDSDCPVADAETLKTPCKCENYSMPQACRNGCTWTNNGCQPENPDNGHAVADNAVPEQLGHVDNEAHHEPGELVDHVEHAEHQVQEEHVVHDVHHEKPTQLTEVAATPPPPPSTTTAATLKAQQIIQIKIPGVSCKDGKCTIPRSKLHNLAHFKKAPPQEEHTDYVAPTTVVIGAVLGLGAVAAYQATSGSPDKPHIDIPRLDDHNFPKSDNTDYSKPFKPGTKGFDNEYKRLMGQLKPKSSFGIFGGGSGTFVSAVIPNGPDQAEEEAGGSGSDTEVLSEHSTVSTEHEHDTSAVVHSPSVSPIPHEEEHQDSMLRYVQQNRLIINREITVAELQQLTALITNGHLRELRLIEIAGTLGIGRGQHVQEFFRSLHLLKHLTFLSFANNRLGAAEMEALADSLQHLKGSLNVLRLSFNHIDSTGAAPLATGLQHLSNLTSLDLSYNNLNAHDVSVLKHAFASLAELTSLDLTRNDIGDEGLTNLQQAIGSLRRLVTLRIGNNSISDRSIDHLMTIINTMSIETLVLTNNTIGNRFINALVERGTNSHIARLEVGDTRVSHEAVKTLLDALHQGLLLKLSTVAMTQIEDTNEIKYGIIHIRDEQFRNRHH